MGDQLVKSSIFEHWWNASKDGARQVYCGREFNGGGGGGHDGEGLPLHAHPVNLPHWWNMEKASPIVQGNVKEMLWNTNYLNNLHKVSNVHVLLLLPSTLSFLFLFQQKDYVKHMNATLITPCCKIGAWRTIHSVERKRTEVNRTQRKRFSKIKK